MKKKKKDTIYIIQIGILLVALVAVGVLFFLRYYNSYMDKILYSERLNQMEEVTGQLFTGLEDVVNTQWNDAKVYCNYLELGQPKDLEELMTFVGKQVKLNNLKEKKTDIVAVDNLGSYYTQDGVQGTLTEMDYLIEEPKQVSFVSKATTTGKAKMYFLYRLANPVSLQVNSKKVTLIYYGLSRDMEELNPYFECDAYKKNNGVCVINPKGEKIFNGNNGEMIKGYNVYSVLKSMDYLHDTSFANAKEKLDSIGKAYSNVVFNQTEYYYSLYQMENAQWIVLFMVPSKYVAVNTVSMMNTTVKLVLIFAIILIVITVCIIAFMLHMKQKQAIAIEKENNEQLAVINQKLEQAVKEADAANKAKSDFLANMSHDIRTPMNAIVGITSLIENEEGISDKLHSYIQKVQTSSRHLLGLINDILDMSRIESNEVKLNIESVSLAEQVSQIDNIIREQTNERKQTFHIYVNEIVHEYLICDGVRLRQILLNLLSNSVKYTQDGGNIELEISEVSCTKPECAKFIYTVTDNGYGMTEEFVKHIFEPFTRAENSVTNKIQGTGLGMAITKNIVDLMGGEIFVESEVGKGSRFTVTLTLPIDKNIDNETTINRLLLVSMDNKLIENVTAMLSESSIKLHVVSIKEETIKCLEQQSPDVILLDNLNLEMIDQLKEIVPDDVLIFGMNCEKDYDMDGMLPYPFFLSNLLVAVEKIKTNETSENEDSTILNGMNFLCAEDNELNAEILEELLDMYGATCTIYPNGEEIVQAFKTVQPGEYDAILMDVQMPKMNGLEATKAIRNSENQLGKTIIIIAMTANAFSEDVQHCLASGMDAHIAKPIDIEVLEKTLRGFIVGGGR